MMTPFVQAEPQRRVAAGAGFVLVLGFIMPRVSLVLAFALGALVHLGSAAQLVTCGFGPPPGSKDTEDLQRRLEQQRIQLGYLLVCDEVLGRYRYADRVQDDRSVAARLSFKPREVAGSEFANLEFLGSIADAFGDKGASMYRRVYRGAQGEILTFQEFSLRGGADVTWPRKDGLVRVRNTVAQLTIVHATSGKAHAELAWKEASSYYEVTIDRGVDSGRTRARLLAMAESLPR